MVRSTAGEPQWIIDLVEDVTDRKRAEAALHQAEKELRTIVDNSRDGINMLDLASGRYVFMSPAQVALTGFTGQELAEMTAEAAYERVHPDDNEISVRQHQAIVEGREPASTVEYRWKVKSGEYRWFSDGRSLVRDEEGRAVALVGVSRDITDQKRGDELLRDAEERFRVAQELSPDGFTIMRPVRDERGRVVDFTWIYENATIGRLNGTAPEAVIGKRLLEMFPGHLGSGFFEAYRHVAETGESRVLEASYQGESITALTWFRVVVVSIGGDIAILAQDITASKRTEEDLRRSREVLEQRVAERTAELVKAVDEVRAERQRVLDVLETLPVIVALLRPDHRVVWINRSYREALGDNVGKLCYDSQFGRDAPCTQCQAFTPLRSGEPHSWEWTLPNGRTFDIHTCPFADVDGSPLILEMDIDTTERHQAERALRELNETLEGRVAERTAELQKSEDALREADRRKDKFLGMLSHELRNPLAPILNSIFLLEHAAPGNEKATRAREVIRRQTEHLTRLVDDLLDVTRIDAREIVRLACDDHRSLFHEHRLSLHIDTSDPAWVDADRTRLAQVVGNLLQNAAKFGHERGMVTVSVDIAGGQVEIRVRDDGIGISPDLLTRLFEPFVQADKGLGLGLALVKGLVEMHGGSVRASSDGLGRGAEFVVCLPLAPPPDQFLTGNPRSVTPMPVKILIIEDSVDTAQSMADLLELEGHRVHIATDGRSGIAKARELRPEVVLCDIGLPDVSGYEVARTLRAHDARSAMRLIALSGFAQPEDVQRACDAGFDSHIPKPPSLEALLALVATGPEV